ncbi:hypothetical protein RJT34_14273 [Clitoria ternatea]|uniref:DUF506 family protein n=1 Tax=Clitoria ternatea TaxID=43366 RepID=A0AAN9JTL4_CLITE
MHHNNTIIEREKGVVIEMAKIPVRFQRVAEAFDAEVARVRLCESSGSEHSPESFTDLSDLVKSFMEKAEEEQHEGNVVRLFEENYEKGDDDNDEELEKSECSDSEKREMLKGLFYGDVERDTKEKIKAEVQLALGITNVGDNSLPGFKRRLMSCLRDRGFDAGLCKSKWEKNGRLTAGDYEYIDVNYLGKRYIVEVSLDAEFEIARPTNQYSSMLDVFPLVFVGKVEELKQVVGLMCTAIKGSMKKMKLHVPPWRRNVYMQAKWFSAYKRTTNAVATRKGSSSHLSAESERAIGFEVRPVKVHNCRGDYVANAGFRIGHLTAVFNSDSFEKPLVGTQEKDPKISEFEVHAKGMDEDHSNSNSQGEIPKSTIVYANVVEAIKEAPTGPGC